MHCDMPVWKPSFPEDPLPREEKAVRSVIYFQLLQQSHEYSLLYKCNFNLSGNI